MSERFAFAHVSLGDLLKSNETRQPMQLYNADAAGNCLTCGNPWETPEATANGLHICEVDMSKAPRFYAEAEYNSAIADHQNTIREFTWYRNYAAMSMKGLRCEINRLEETGRELVEIIEKQREELEQLRGSAGGSGMEVSNES